MDKKLAIVGLIISVVALAVAIFAMTGGLQGGSTAVGTSLPSGMQNNYSVNTNNRQNVSMKTAALPMIDVPRTIKQIEKVNPQNVNMKQMEFSLFLKRKNGQETVINIQMTIDDHKNERELMVSLDDDELVTLQNIMEEEGGNTNDVSMMEQAMEMMISVEDMQQVLETALLRIVPPIEVGGSDCIKNMSLAMSMTPSRDMENIQLMLNQYFYNVSSVINGSFVSSGGC